MEGRERERDREEVYTEKIRAGKRTYFFDVRATRSNDYYITITESKRKLNGHGYEKHKIFLYKEDFNKFVESLNKTVDYVKTELMPDYDYDEFKRDRDSYSNPGYEKAPAAQELPVAAEPKAEVETEVEVETELSTKWED